MIRIILQNIILFLLPTLIYLLVIVIRLRPQSLREIDQLFARGPFVWLFGAGLALMIGGLAYFNTHTGGKPGEAYQPPVYKDGKVIPGQRK